MVPLALALPPPPKKKTLMEREAVKAIFASQLYEPRLATARAGTHQKRDLKQNRCIKIKMKKL